MIRGLASSWRIALGLAALAIAIGSAPARSEASSPGGAQRIASCASVEYGTGAAAEGEYDRGVSPNANGPTLVAFGVRVLELSEIDPVRGAYRMRAYARTTWCDPRLSDDARAAAGRDRVYTGPSADRIVQEEIWFPAAYPVNQTGELRITERVVRILPDGTVLQELNFSASLASHFDLRRFPFDTQSLEMQVESFAWPAEVVKLIADPEQTGVDSALELAEWQIESATGQVTTVRRTGRDVAFSRMLITTRIARRPGFYLWKVFLPLIIIVALSWSVFWMTDESFASRSRTSGTGVLTIVAYQFVFTSDLPRVGYLTLLDKMMIASFSLLAVTVLQSLLVSRYQDADRERAVGIDKLSRWAFPTVYAAALALVWLGG